VIFCYRTKTIREENVMLTPSQLQELLGPLNQNELELRFKCGRPRIVHLEFKVTIRSQRGKTRSSLYFLWPSKVWTKKAPTDGWALASAARTIYGICRDKIIPVMEKNGSVSICFRLSAYSKTVYVGLRKTHSKDYFGRGAGHPRD